MRFFSGYGLQIKHLSPLRNPWISASGGWVTQPYLFTVFILRILVLNLLPSHHARTRQLPLWRWRCYYCSKGAHALFSGYTLSSNSSFFNNSFYCVQFSLSGFQHCNNGATQQTVSLIELSDHLFGKFLVREMGNCRYSIIRSTPAFQCFPSTWSTLSGHKKRIM